MNDIIVTNNDGRGTVSVFLPAARPPVTVVPKTNTFDVTVNVPNPQDIQNLTVNVDLTYPNLSEMSLQLVAPDGESITLFNYQLPPGTGPAITSQGLPGGAALGVFGYAPPNNFGIDVGTVFDDNATRNIFDPTTTGTNGNAAPYIGHFRAEAAPGDTRDLADRLRQVGSQQ